MHDGTFKSLASGQLFVVDSGGDGVPFVLIHGLGGSHINWIDIFDPLAKRARTIAIDLPGYGYSPPIQRHDLDGLTRSVTELLESLGEPCVVIANSMGGLVAEMTASTRPDLIADLILIAPASPPPLRARPANTRVAARVAIQSVPILGHGLTGLMRRTIPADKRALALLDVVTADRSLLSEDTIAASLALATRRNQLPWTTRALVESTASIRRMFFPKRRFVRMINRIEIDALVLSGALDPVVIPEAIDALEVLRPDWQFERHAGLGHVPQLEDADWVLEAIDSWLERERRMATPDDAVPSLTG